MIGVGLGSRQPKPLESEPREARSCECFGIDPRAALLPGKGRQLVLELPRTSQAPGMARRWLFASFAEELDSRAHEKAQLLVSELVTNAVVHGRGRMEIHAQLDRDRLLVEVIDEGPGFTPAVGERDPESAGGDGLRIVDEEASRWGIREGAAHVWFELRRHRPGSDRKVSDPVPGTKRPRVTDTLERSVDLAEQRSANRSRALAEAAPTRRPQLAPAAPRCV